LSLHALFSSEKKKAIIFPVQNWGVKNPKHFAYPKLNRNELIFQKIYKVWLREQQTITRHGVV